MMTIAYQLRRDEREAVAGYLGQARRASPARAPQAFCRDRTRHAGRPAPRRSGTDGVRRATTRGSSPAALAGLTAEQVPRLKLKWAFGFDGDMSAFAQPTVIGGQVFVGSAGGVVHALRADTGCLQWMFQANGPDSLGDRRRAVDGRQRAAVRRSHRLVLRARCRDRAAASGRSDPRSTRRCA